MARGRRKASTGVSATWHPSIRGCEHSAYLLRLAQQPVADDDYLVGDGSGS
jgi:hypothetical protein